MYFAGKEFLKGEIEPTKDNLSGFKDRANSATMSRWVKIYKTIETIHSIIWPQSEIWFGVLTLMLLVTNLDNTKWFLKPEKWLKPWHIGTHIMRVLGESYPMNTNITGFRWFHKCLCPCALGWSSFSNGRVNNWSRRYKINESTLVCLVTCSCIVFQNSLAIYTYSRLQPLNINIGRKMTVCKYYSLKFIIIDMWRILYMYVQTPSQWSLWLG